MQQVNSIREIEEFLDENGDMVIGKNNKNDMVFNTQKLYKRDIRGNTITDYSEYVDKEILFFDKSQYFQGRRRTYA